MGAGKHGLVDARMDTVDVRLGRLPCVEAIYSGTETGDTQVVGEPCSGDFPGLVLRTAGWDEGGRSRDRGQGGG